MKKLVIVIIGMLLTTHAALAQTQPDTLRQKHPQEKKLIDQIVAVVATRPILESDLVDPDDLDASRTTNATSKCKLLENLILQKLLINKAEIDTLPVADGDVDQELDRRLGIMLRQLGSQEKLEQFYHKSMADFKSDQRLPIKEQLMAEGHLFVSETDITTLA